MVGAENIRVDFCAFESVFKAFGSHKVVDTPTCVLCSCLKTITPPGVRSLQIGIEMAEAVDKTRAQQLGKLSALLIGEAGVAAVAFGIFDVDLLMSHVEVAAIDHRLLCIQLH